MAQSHKRPPGRYGTKMASLTLFLILSQHTAYSQFSSSDAERVAPNDGSLLIEQNDNSQIFPRTIQSTIDVVDDESNLAHDDRSEKHTRELRYFEGGGEMNNKLYDEPSQLLSLPILETDEIPIEGAGIDLSDKSNACAAHAGCNECYSASFCHWCGGDDGACHAKGSIHGCIKGESCSSSDNGGHGSNDDGGSDGGGSKKDNSGSGSNDSGKDSSDDSGGDVTPSANTCASHVSCDACYSSELCHWCGGDDGACHVKGSIHGCFRGASCSANKGNNTDGGGGSGGDDGGDSGDDSADGDDSDDGGGKTPEKDTCASHDSCDACYSSELCHWCGGDDGACHVKGSIHGCFRGASCSANKGNNTDGGGGSGADGRGSDGGGDKPPEKDTCAAHDSCDSCYSSKLCHWCGGGDGRCHAKGSVHGCLYGASCSAGKNSTDGGNHSGNDSDGGGDKPPEKDTCASHDSCDACYSSKLCHWCGGADGACHAKGSVHGCFYGASCAADNPDKTDKSCASHTNCTECALSSHFCHWCAFDDKCHAVGSVHGCFTGVSCLANDQCQREHPQKVSRFVFTSIGFIPFIIIISIGTLVVLCASGCYAGAGCMRGAYDDMFNHVSNASIGGGMSLGEIRGVGDEEETDSLISNLEGGRNEKERGEQKTSRLENLKNMFSSKEDTDLKNVADDIGDSLLSSEERDQDDKEREEKKSNGLTNLRNMFISKEDTGHIDTTHDVDDSLMLSEGTERRSQEYVLLEEREDKQEVKATPGRVYFDSSSVRHIPRAEHSEHARQLFNLCKACYIVTVVITLILVSFSVIFYPKLPEYSVCNNEFEWKSVIDSMKSTELEASIEVLLSIYNPNHFDVDIDKGSGTFKHNDKVVGNWNFPDGTEIKASSITDLPLRCTVIPDEWEALALAKEYYKGTLVLDAQVKAKIRIPALFNYTFKADMDDYIVRVNDPNRMDRHLCACPQWKDLKPPKHL